MDGLTIKFCASLVAFVGAASLLLGCSGGLRQAPSGETAFAGVWVTKYYDRNLLVLSLSASDEGLRGSLRWPRELQVDGGGCYSNISEEHAELNVVRADGAGRSRVLHVSDGSETYEFTITLVDDARAEMRPAGFPEWMQPFLVERASVDDELSVGTGWTAAITGSPELAALRNRLLAMEAEDQAVRREVPMRTSRVQAVDEEHLPEILRIYDEHGWPGYSLVGCDGANAFSLLVQHQELDLQRQLLPDLEAAVARGDASPERFALLYDRVRSREGDLQRWGTQTQCVDGEAVLDPVEDPDALDKRRRELHLPPIETYLEQLNETCRNVIDDLSP